MASHQQHFHGPLLKLHPIVGRAKSAVSTMLTRLAHYNLPAHHASYYVETGTSTWNTEYERRREESPIEDQRTQMMFRDGYLSISFDSPRVENFGQISWTFGRGSEKIFGPATRGVDVLLGPPSTLDCKGIAPVHFRIYIHPKSHAWILEPYANMHVNRRSLTAGDKVVLTIKDPVLEVADLAFQMEFMIQNDQ